jgi:hypothetical protein
MGNTLIMLGDVVATMMSITELLGVEPRYTTLADGDNCLVFVEAKRANWVHANFASILSNLSARELEVGPPVTVFEHVVFGQCKPLELGGGRVTMVRDPWKVLSGALCGHRHYDHMVHGRKVLKVVSQCELALASGVPLLQAYFATVVERLETTRDLSSPEDYLEGSLLAAVRFQGLDYHAARVVPITLEARLSFEKAWGISVPYQHALEESLKSGITFPDVWAQIHVADGVDGWSLPSGDTDWLDGLP